MLLQAQVLVEVLPPGVDLLQVQLLELVLLELVQPVALVGWFLTCLSLHSVSAAFQTVNI